MRLVLLCAFPSWSHFLVDFFRILVASHPAQSFCVLNLASFFAFDTVAVHGARWIKAGGSWRLRNAFEICFSPMRTIDSFNVISDSCASVRGSLLLRHCKRAVSDLVYRRLGPFCSNVIAQRCPTRIIKIPKRLISLRMIDRFVACVRMNCLQSSRTVYHWMPVAA